MLRLLCLSVVSLSASSLARGVTLSNDFLRVEIDESIGGITSIADAVRNETFHTSGSIFQLRIKYNDGEKLSLQPETMTYKGLTHNDPSTVSSHWTASQGFNVSVEFRLEQGWHFVSKRFSVQTANTEQRPTIDSVHLLSSNVSGCTFSSTFVQAQSGFLRCSESQASAPSVGASGLYFTVANPYARVSVQLPAHGLSSSDCSMLAAEYTNVGIQITPTEPVFTSDMVLMGTYSQRTGQGAWVRPHTLGGVDHNARPPKMLNSAERDVIVETVRAFLIQPTDAATRTVKTNVAWDENDFQIDIATAEGRKEYERIISRNADFGVSHIVFAPANTDLTNGDFFVNRSSVLDVGWGYVLWMGMGLGIRNGTWSNVSGVDVDLIREQVPQSLMSVLKFAKSKGVRVMPYVYPIIVGFTPRGFGPPGTLPNGTDDDCSAAPWLYTSKNAHMDRLTCHSDLGSPEYQTWLLNALSTFYVAFEDYIGGFAFDGVFLGEAHNHTNYAQWRGWANILEGLKRRHPELVIDNRLSAHGLGPWHMLAGSYDEPIAGDENPETYGIPVTSISTDHVAADNLRRVNLWYMQGSLLPMERVPGFLGHQTERSRLPQGEVGIGSLCSNGSHGGTEQCYRRDFDFLGYRYAVMSQVATAGLNNVLCMIPARDEAEFDMFPKEDISFVKKWLTWTDAHIPMLRQTVPLPGMDEVGLGLLDGTAAFARPLACVSGASAEEALGYIWLFNPSYANTSGAIVLDSGLSRFDECLIASPVATSVTYDVIEVYRCGSEGPFGDVVATNVAYGHNISVELDGSSCVMLEVVQSRGARVVHSRDVLWSHAQRVELDSSTVLPDGNVSLRGTTTVPQTVLDQLKARKAAYPIPWTVSDQDASWLQPHRLLLFLQLNCSTGRSGACDDGMPASLRVDGHLVEGLKAYETRCTECTGPNHPLDRRKSARFNGWYWDVSETMKPGLATHVELQLPEENLQQVVALAFENTQRIMKVTEGAAILI